MPYAIPDQRELPNWLKPSSPTQAMAELMRRHRAALAHSRAETQAALDQSARLAVAIGLALYRKRSAANSSEFRTMEDALAAAGGLLITHAGEPFAGDLEELADVVEWVEAKPGISPGCIADAFEPEIRLNGRLVHRAKLVCVLEDAAPDSAHQPTNAHGNTAEDTVVEGDRQ